MSAPLVSLACADQISAEMRDRERAELPASGWGDTATQKLPGAQPVFTLPEDFMREKKGNSFT